jgi:hypothetical protein
LSDSNASTPISTGAPGGLAKHSASRASRQTWKSPMNFIASALVASTAAILLLLGLGHLLFTFYGSKLLPRDRDLLIRMQEVSPVITQQTTMWKAWIGFNASHSFGLILFGSLYGYIALAHGQFLFQSVFLLTLGIVVLLGYVFLSKQFFFRFPLRAVLLATALYVVALAVGWSL